MSKVNNYLLCIACVFLMISCRNDEFAIGDRWVNPNFRTFMLDTLSVELTTVRDDSIVTQNKNTILVGVYKDEYVGKTTAGSFIELSLPSNTDIDDDAIFDSICIETWYNKSYFGDTTKLQHLEVFQLAEEIELKGDSKNFYNTTTFKLDTILGEQKDIVVKPTFNSQYRTTGMNGESDMYSTPLRIMLKKSLGEEFLKKMKENAEEFKDNEHFVDYFKGIYIGQNNSDSRSIVGLRTDSSFRLRIYYHIDNESRVDQHIDFTINQSKQFNNIIADRSGTKLAKENFDEMNELSSFRTDNMAFMQSGDNLFIKMEFPTLNTILSLGRLVAIERAILRIRPVDASLSDNTPLPPALYLYASRSIDEEREIILNPSTNQPQTGNLVVDDPYLETGYTYDITNFAASQLGASREGFLLLSFPELEKQNTVQRAVFGNADFSELRNRINLEIYYTIYN